MRTYTSAASALAFPLGGIGTGTVSLGARGDLRDWEIFNRPAKGTVLPNTFFAIRVQPEGNAPVTRVLEGLIPTPYNRSHGFDPESAGGLPRFAKSTFSGEYPFANITFEDARVPVNVTLEAYTPLIPLNPDDSGIPAAIFTYRVHNPTDKPVELTLVGSMMNPVGHWYFDPTNSKRDKQLGTSLNRFREDAGYRGLHLSAAGIDPDALEYGTVSLVTDHANVTYKRAWLRGGWWDFLREFWDDLADDGRLNDLGYGDTPHTYPETASLGLIDTLPAGETRDYRFVLAWYFPNRLNTWDMPTTDKIRNHYTVQFPDSWDAAGYVFTQLPRLEGETRKFHDALFTSTLPDVVLDRVSSNIVPIRSNTCFWLEDGRFLGWEGCGDDYGSCPGNCTHVWSYVYTLAYLFPSLEREMRRLEFNVEIEPDGYMPFRLLKSFNPEWVWTMHNEKIAAVDGQMGTILRAYREWLLSGDRDWLSRMWGGIKLAIDYVNIAWDRDGDGVLEGRQHNTYDIEFFGANPLTTFYYLAALRAVSAMAQVMDEPELASRCDEVFARGSAKADALMWNGTYYKQDIENIDEHKYQFGVGVLSDAMLGVLHARVLGLGDILPREHIHTAIKTIFDRNFLRDFHEHVNAQRTFVLNDEQGLLLCSWLPGEPRPRLPFIYSDEVWTGIEYHVAALLLYEGYIDEALTMVEAVNDRHDGIRRNPWNEVECGHHYARSMSSWLVKLALTGFYSDVATGIMRFDPLDAAFGEDGTFKTFWSNGVAWGTLTQRPDGDPQIEVLGGSLDGISVFVGDHAVDVISAAT